MATSYRVFLGAPFVRDVLDEVEETLSSSTNLEPHGWHAIETTLSAAAATNPDVYVLPVTVQETQLALEQPGGDTSRLTIADRTRLESTSLFQTSNRRRHDGAADGSRSLASASAADDGDDGDVLPHTTLAEASQRLSRLYANVIFPDQDEDEEMVNQERSMTESFEESAVTWEATDPSNAAARPGGGASSRGGPPDQTFIRSSGEPSRLDSRMHKTTETGTQLETQTDESEEDSNSDESMMEEETTDGDSIGRFPTFHFGLHRLSSLGTLLKASVPRREKRLVCLLVAILEVDGPTVITTKSGVEMGLLKLIIGDDTGAVAKMVVWRETALKWGGGEDRSAEGAVRKGDVVYLENVAITYAHPAPPSISASPNEKSAMIICYRTLKILREDRRYRPDLRLGHSDPALRRVSMLVDWVEGVANINR